jgi:hypothetical protein
MTDHLQLDYVLSPVIGGVGADTGFHPKRGSEGSARCAPIESATPRSAAALTTGSVDQLRGEHGDDAYQPGDVEVEPTQAHPLSKATSARLARNRRRAEDCDNCPPKKES